MEEGRQVSFEKDCDPSDMAVTAYAVAHSTMAWAPPAASLDSGVDILAAWAGSDKTR